MAATPPTVPSGRVSFALFNIGVLVHELVVVLLPADEPWHYAAGMLNILTVT